MIIVFDKLFSISQVTFKPIQDNTTKSVMSHFIQENIMLNGKYGK